MPIGSRRTGFFALNFFVPEGFPDPAFRLEAVTRDLAARRPRYIVFERLNAASAMGTSVDSLVSSDPHIARLLEAYQLETRIEDFTLFRRTD